MKLLFVGEARSALAVAKGWRWQDGRLAGKTLLDALGACGIAPEACQFVNWFEPGGPALVHRLLELEPLVVGMGQKVQAALRQAGISHTALIHPAARGTIRRKENYIQHVADTLLPLLH